MLFKWLSHGTESAQIHVDSRRSPIRGRRAAVVNESGALIDAVAASLEETEPVRSAWVCCYPSGVNRALIG